MDLSNLLTSKLFYICVLAIILIIGFAIYILRRKLSNTWFYKKIVKILTDFSEGIKSIIRMEKKGLFILYTILIYLMYFLMTYVVFFSFDFTKDLGLMVALSILVMGSLGIMAVQGGLGAYHLLVAQTLLIYGIAIADGEAFALVMHGGNTLGMIIFGFLALIYLPIYNRKRQFKMEN